MQPETKYARSSDVSIAYQVVGDRGPDLVLVPGWISHVEYMWEEVSFGPFFRRLATFARLILLDRRGTGLSDRVTDQPSIEERMDDVRAVMDAAGVGRATLFGLSEGGPMCITFAATYPERTAALVLYGTLARLTVAPDYPIGSPPEAVEKYTDRVFGSTGSCPSAGADYFGGSGPGASGLGASGFGASGLAGGRRGPSVRGAAGRSW